jgi:hypothetical protein
MMQGQPLTEDRDAVGDPLAARLLPVLMHRMNNATQLLSNLHAMSQYGGDRDWIEEHANDLAECSTDIDRMGYLLAVLASACGADLLLKRRIVRGLEVMGHGVLDVVRRDGGAMNGDFRGLPDLAPEIHNGWEFPWAFGSLLYQASVGSSEKSNSSLSWQLLAEDESWVLVSSMVPADRFQGIHSQIIERLPESQLDICAEGWSWRFPGAWLRL